MCKIFSCAVLLTLCSVCCGYKLLLVFPFPSNSYAILGEKYAKLLMKAGHEVTYVTPFLMKNSTNTLRQIQISGNVRVVPDKYWNITNILNKNIAWDNIQNCLNIAFKLSNGTVLDPNVQRLLLDPKEEFDAVIADWFYSEIVSGFAVVFNCPLIWATSMEPNAFVLRLLNKDLGASFISGQPNPPFAHWAMEQFRFLRMRYNRWLISDKEGSLFNKAFGPAMEIRGRVLPSFEEVKYNASLVLGNSHPTIDRTLGLPINYVSISGYHIVDNSGMSKTVQTIMDNAHKGVIVFSMGSDFKSNSLPTGIRTTIFNVFKQMNKTVLWKYEGSLEVPNNIHTMSWLPQQGVLAHPNCVLLITSGGLHSINEAVHFGVPIIGIPFLRDQANNIEKVINKGIAKKVEPDNIAFLKAAIDEVLNNSTYKSRAQQLSLIYRDRPNTPSEDLVFWIEYVIRTQGALHLRSTMPLWPWYQNLYLEMILVAIIVVAVLSKLIKTLLEKRRRENDFEFKKFI